MALSPLGQFTAHTSGTPRAGLRPKEVCLCDYNKAEYRDMALTSLPQGQANRSNGSPGVVHLKCKYICMSRVSLKSGVSLPTHSQELLINLAKSSKASTGVAPKEWLHRLRMLEFHHLGGVIPTLKTAPALGASGHRTKNR